MTVTEAVLRAKLQTIQKRLAEDGSHKRCIGVIGGGWTGPDILRLDGADYRVVYCESALAVREAMDGLNDEGRRLVVVTSCPDAALGADVQARVFRNRFHAIDPWQTVRDLFQATSIGPGVPQEPWLRDELVDSTAEQRPALLAGTVLDLETVKQVVFRRLGIPRSASDLGDLMAWANTEHAGAYARRDPALRSCVRQWIEDSLGKASGAIVDCVAEGHGVLVLPLGLALRVMVGTKGLLEATQREGLVRAERFVASRRLTESEVGAWAEAAERHFHGLAIDEVRRRREVLAEADRLLDVLGVRELAHLSNYLQEGLRQRERRFALALEHALESGTGDLAEVEAAAKAVVAHELAGIDRARVLDAAVPMAVRLLRWLRRRDPVETSRGFVAEALSYAREGSYVDWAREQTTHGYPHAELQRALRKLWDAVQHRRERGNRAFAEACVTWHQAPEQAREIVLLENVLSEVVRPLAEHAPVLLTVMDGMSLSVFHELTEGFPKLGWLEIGPSEEAERGMRRYGVAVLPTVTEVSRASLLSGQIRRGSHEDEVRTFEGSQLLTIKGQAPRLFHKGTLSGDRLGIEPEVEAALRGPHRVVGVVLNVVDDWLGKGSEDAARWEVERIKSLVALLDVAAQTGRVVVMTSDHGHVRDHETLYVEGAGGTRWRPAGSAPADGEALVRSSRVCLASGEHAAVLPWTESMRYTKARQNGYHGGISPQEVLVPVAVFGHAGSPVPVPGFAEVPPGLPAWWDAAEAVPTARVERPAKPKARPEPLLPFADGRAADLEALIASELFQEQRKLHLRGYPGDDKLRLVLRALGERGDAMLLDALANQLDLARVRVQGIVTSLRRVLNYDGTECLEFDAQSGTVRVHWSMLRTVFDLREGGR
jgi:hypothetical protein